MKKTGLYYFSLIVLLFMVYHFAYADEAKEEYLVYQYNENVRIVLSKVECPKENGPGKRAAAQRIDKHYLRGCWLNDPDIKGNIKIKWDGGDNSTFPVENFYPVKE
jgi:hypothetical protein